MPTGSDKKHHRRKSTGKDKHSDNRISQAGSGQFISAPVPGSHSFIKMTKPLPNARHLLASSSSPDQEKPPLPEPGDVGLSASNPVSPVKLNISFSRVSRKRVNDEKSSLTLKRSDGSEKTFHILNQLSVSDRESLEKAHPYVAKKIVGNNPADIDIDIPRLGQGTFSFISLAKDESGLFYAVRAVLNETELPMQIPALAASSNSNLPEIFLSSDDNEQSSAPPIPLVPRGKVLLDTMSEIEVHSLLRSRGLDDEILLIKDAVVVQNPEGIQIYQFLPLADLGSGLDIIYKASYLGEKEKEHLFYHVFQKLVPAMVKIHAANMAINDVKPENTLFTRDAQVSFSDFGAACYLDDSGKLKVTSALNDNRYSAPYSDMPISPGLTSKNRAHRQIEYNMRMLHKNQRCDLWSLALTLLQFWEPAMVEEFYDAAISRRYSPIRLETSDKPLTQFGLFRKVVTNDYSTPVFGAVIEPMAETSSAPEIKLPSAEQVILIYKEELQRHIFSSSAFAKLPTNFQELFKSMLQLDEEINLKNSLFDMLSANLFSEQIEVSRLSETLDKMLVADGLIAGNDGIVSLFHQFQTLPNRRFNAYLSDAIEKKIVQIFEKMPEIALLQQAFEKSTPAEYINDVLPTVLQLKLAKEDEGDTESNSYRFLLIMESLCHDDLPYESILNSLNVMVHTLERDDSPAFVL